MKKKKKKWNSGTIESPTDDASLQPQLFMPTYFHHTLCVFWYRCGCFALDCNSRDYSFSRTDQRKSNQFISEFLYIMSSGRFFLSLYLSSFSLSVVCIYAIVVCRPWSANRRAGPNNANSVWVRVRGWWWYGMKNEFSRRAIRHRGCCRPTDRTVRFDSTHRSQPNMTIHEMHNSKCTFCLSIETLK